MRGRLPWLALGVACAVQLVGIARTSLPSHDGLKILRTAASFQKQPWPETIRATDRHPLYPILVAAVEPGVRLFFRNGSESWRIAAQGVSAVCGIAVLIPLFLLTNSLFGETAAHWAALLWAVLPIPAELAHETLADPVALLCFTASLWALDRATQSRPRTWCALAGLFAGLGYWARPEVALIAAVGAAWILTMRTAGGLKIAWRDRILHVAALLLPVVALVGGYAAAKGELSEKLALRRTLGMAPSALPTSRPTTSLEPFSAKPNEGELEVPPGLPQATFAMLAAWARVLGIGLAPLAIAGAFLAAPSPTRRLLRWYIGVASILILRHVHLFHYLSNRHVLTLAIATLPWASWRLTRLGDRVAAWLRVPAQARFASHALAVGAVLALCFVSQGHQSHPSRDAHRRAGLWLSTQSQPGDAVFDTNGWAAFVAERTWHDPWHLCQALADQRLKYLVLESSELSDPSTRGAQLRSLLAHRATPVARFEVANTQSPDYVIVYQYDQADRGGRAG